MKTYSRVYAKIDLDAVAWNMEQMKKNLKEGTEMVAVIKTDGYGHGAVQVASMLESYDYVWGYAVATLDEAVVLRAAEIQKPILVLGCIFPDQYWEMLKYEIRMRRFQLWQSKKGSRHMYISNWIPGWRGLDFLPKKAVLKKSRRLQNFRI